MNAVTVDEVIYVPLSKLRVSDKNVRKKGGLSIPVLKALIRSEGLLQNLIATRGPNGTFDVVDGKRRFLALQELSKELLLDLDREVPVKIIDAKRATSASLAAAFSQLPLHPVDQFEAFKALVEEGLSVPEIAARFGVDERAIQQRLKLAAVAPAIREAYRDEQISLEILQAFTLTDDQNRQMKVFKNLPRYGTDAYRAEQIKTHLTDKLISSDDPVARIVGVETYEAAGGVTRKDMFSPTVYFADGALLQRIADAKVFELEERVKAEGWSWVEVKLQHVGLYNYQHRKPKVRPTTPEEDAALAAIKSKQEVIGKELAALRGKEPEDDESPSYAAWEAELAVRKDEHARLEQSEKNIHDARASWSAKTLAEAGAIITIGDAGALTVHRGLVDQKTAKRLEKAKQKVAAEKAGETTEAAEISDALHQRLTAHRSAVIRRQLQLNRRAMLAVLAHSLSGHTFGHSGWTGDLTQIGGPPQDGAHATAGVDMDEYVSHLNLSLDRSKAYADLPSGEAEALTWLLKQDEGYLLELIAACVATSFNGIYGKTGWRAPERKALVEVLVEHLDIDMREHWQATRETYFNYVPKPLIVQAVTEARGEVAARSVAALSKGDAAEAAEIQLDSEEWLPPLFRRTAKARAASTEGPSKASDKVSKAAKGIATAKHVSQEEAVAHIQHLLDAKKTGATATKAAVRKVPAKKATAKKATPKKAVKKTVAKA